ncbi:MAG: TonB C-terminal domain-containing protein [Rhodobacteraceae bacterium]|nr:TonB C-terminal domain-containing protein [Paracoccaceae bacterium]
MIRLIEPAVFVAVAAAVHVGLFAVAPSRPGGAGSGDGGEDSLSLRAANAGHAALVRQWTTAPQAQTAAAPPPEMPVVTAVARPPAPLVDGPARHTRPGLPPAPDRVALPQVPPAAPALTDRIAAGPQAPTPPASAPVPSPSPRMAAPVVSVPPTPPTPATPATPAEPLPRAERASAPPPEAAPAEPVTRAPATRPVARPAPAATPQPAARAAGRQPAARSTAGADRAQPDAQGTGTAQTRRLQAEWGAGIQRKVHRALRYPRGASGAGTARVALTVDRRGRLRAVSLVRSSGNPGFDDAALRAVHRAGRFAAAPAGLSRESYSFTMALNFRP